MAQLYLAYPPSAGEPPKNLRGFKKVHLAVGASTMVSFTLRGVDTAIYNSSSKKWQPVSGQFSLMIGASSRDIRLTGTILV